MSTMQDQAEEPRGRFRLSERAMKIIIAVELAVLCVPLLYFGTRIFICDKFIVKGQSMEPTLHSGQPVYVNKLKMGGRIYTKFDFEEDSELHCFRMPGFRRLRPGDIAIYNYQYGRGGRKIAFKINYVYAKRCVGCPSDTISIVDCHYANSSVDFVGVPLSNEAALRAIPDSVLLSANCLKAGRFAGERENWTIKDFGPIVVPAKGMTIKLDSISRAHYSIVLEYETGLAPEDVPGPDYTFKEDYYFFAGDNVVNSRDGRYDGFVPEKYIVGIIAPH